MKAKVDRIPCDYEYRCSLCGELLSNPEEQAITNFAESYKIIISCQKYCSDCGAELEWDKIYEKDLEGFFSKDLIPIGEQAAKGFEEGIKNKDPQIIKIVEEMSKELKGVGVTEK